MASVEDVRQKLSEPYSEIKKHCLILTRLHDTSNLLRCIDRVQKLAKNITVQEMLPGSIMIREVGECDLENFDRGNSILRARRTLSDEFCQDIDITGVNIVENDLRIVENERQRIRTNAKKSLIEALATENKKQVSPLFENVQPVGRGLLCFKNCRRMSAFKCSQI